MSSITELDVGNKCFSTISDIVKARFDMPLYQVEPSELLKAVSEELDSMAKTLFAFGSATTQQLTDYLEYRDNAIVSLCVILSVPPKQLELALSFE